MGLSLTTVEALLGIWKDGHFNGKKSILELGSQELHLTLDNFERAVEAYQVPGFEREAFEPWEWENRGRCVYADKFYSILGLSEYMCFDMNAENNAIPHDLNFPFKEKQHLGKYDVVTDFGCAEHVFNVSEAYKTMHATCTENGLLIYCQQVKNTNGYYNFDTAFYEDLAAANNYKIHFTAHLVNAPASMKDSHRFSWMLPLSTEILDILDHSKVETISVFYVMEKTSDNEFILPYQGQYMSTQYGNDGYDVAAMMNYKCPSRSYVPVIDRYSNVSSKVFKKTCKAYFKKKFLKK